MLLQALVLPLWLALAAGSPGAQGGGISWRPFAQAFAEHVAPALGWQPNTAGPVTGYSLEV